MIAQCVKKETGKKIFKKAVHEWIVVSWLVVCHNSAFDMGRARVGPRNKRERDKKKPIQYCNSLELKKEGISLWEIFAEMKLAYKSCWNSSKHWNYNEIQLTVSFRCKRMRLVCLCGDCMFFLSCDVNVL